MAVTGLPAWDLAALIGGSDFRIYTIEANRDLQDVLIGETEAFWRDNIIAKKAPDPTSPSAYAEYLARLYAQPGNTLRPINPLTEDGQSVLAKVVELAHARADSAKALDAKKAAENALKDVIGNDAGIEFPDGKITWKMTKGRKVFDAHAAFLELFAALQKYPDAHALAQKIYFKHHTTKPGSRRFLASGELFKGDVADGE